MVQIIYCPETDRYGTGPAERHAPAGCYMVHIVRDYDAACRWLDEDAHARHILDGQAGGVL